MIKFLRDFSSDTNGNIAMLFGIAIVPLVLTVGIGIDYGRGISARTNLQAATDSAALAGAVRLGKPRAKVSEVEEAASKTFTSNLNAQTFPSLVPIVTVDRNNNTVQVTASGPVPTTFMQIGGVASMMARADATAGVAYEPWRVCVLALNPHAVDSLYIHGSGEVAASSCRFHANSDDPVSALKVQGSFTVTTAGICAAGTSYVSGSPVMSPPATSNCGVIADPLANWVAPSLPTACDYGYVNGVEVGTSISSSTSVTMSPGRYCGATKISAGNLTLLPGRYFFSGGKVSINANADILGDGVYIHIDPTAAAFSINGSAAVRLTKAGDADLSGVLIYKAPDPTGILKFKSNLNGGSDNFFRGTVYLPGDEFLLGGNSSVQMTQQPDMTIIADKVELYGQSYLAVKSDATIATTSAFPPQPAQAKLLQ
jgi:Flp pilus assembly protein TadG